MRCSTTARVQRQPQGQGRPTIGPLRETGREGRAGQLDDLQGPHGPAHIGRKDVAGGGGIAVGERAVGRLGAVRRGIRLPPRADRGVGGWDVERVQGGPDIEAGAADEDRHPATGRDRVEIGPGGGLIGGDACLLGHLEDVELMVRYAAPLPHRDLGRPDVHAAIELHGVGIDDLAADLAGEREGERRLAGRGRPHDRDDDRVSGQKGPRPRRASSCGPAAPTPRCESP
jgi:hypothetical protein